MRKTEECDYQRIDLPAGCRGDIEVRKLLSVAQKQYSGRLMDPEFIIACLCFVLFLWACVHIYVLKRRHCNKYRSVAWQGQSDIDFMALLLVPL